MKNTDGAEENGGPMSKRIGVGDMNRREGIEVIEKAAGCDKNVLILGETGTGKDVAARRIHELKIGRAHV